MGGDRKRVSSEVSQRKLGAVVLKQLLMSGLSRTSMLLEWQRQCQGRIPWHAHITAYEPRNRGRELDFRCSRYLLRRLDERRQHGGFFIAVGDERVLIDVVGKLARYRPLQLSGFKTGR